MEVYVTHAESPTELYCQLATAATELPLFEDKLVDHCNTHPQMSAGDVSVNDVCVAQCDVSWCRARVTDVTEHALQVFYVDYGNSASVPRSAVRGIEAEFLAWPVQVFRCRLAAIEPLASAAEWDDASTARLRELCEDTGERDNKVFTMHVERVHRDTRGEISALDIDLLDSTGNSLACQLVEGGYAQNCSTDKLLQFEGGYAQICSVDNEPLHLEPISTSQDCDQAMLEDKRLSIDFQNENNAENSQFAQVAPAQSQRGETGGGYEQQSGADGYAAWSAEDGRSASAHHPLATVHEEQGSETTSAELDALVGSIVRSAILSGHQQYLSQSESMLEESRTCGIEDSALATCTHVKSPGDFTLTFTDGVVARCRLAGIEPCEGSTWSEEAYAAFTELVENTSLHVNTVKRRPCTSRDDAQEQRDVFVYDVGDVAHVSLNRLLVHRGVARCVGDQLLDDTSATQAETSFLDLSSLRCDSFGSLDESGIADSSEGEAFGQVTCHVGEELALRFVTCMSEALVCQLLASSEQLQQLNADIAARYAGEEVPVLEEPQAGQPCMVRCLDTRWQRCQVIDVLEEGQIKVLAVDEGEAHIVKDARLLHQEYLRLPAQALSVRLHGCQGLDDNQNEIYDLLEENHCGADGRVLLTAHVMEVLGDNTVTATVKTSDGTDLLQELLESKLVSATVTDTSTDSGEKTFDSSKSALCTSLPETVVREGECQLVMLTHADTPHSFWCQLQDPAYTSLLTSMQEIYGSEDCPADCWMNESEICVVQADSHWYRGKVTSEFEGVYLVQCVDEGMTVTTSRVFPLLEEFGTLPPQALHCSLLDVTPLSGTEWSAESEGIMTVYLKHEFLMHVHEIAPPLHHVALNHVTTCQSLRQQLLDAQLVRPAE